MILLPEFIRMLGSQAEGLSDEEILKRKDHMEKLVALLYDLWLEERRKRKRK